MLGYGDGTVVELNSSDDAFSSSHSYASLGASIEVDWEGSGLEAYADMYRDAPYINLPDGLDPSPGLDTPECSRIGGPVRSGRRDRTLLSTGRTPALASPASLPSQTTPVLPASAQ